MKVLLFNPPGPAGRGYTREGRCTQEEGVWASCWPPLSLATAAALLERDGHDVRLVDFPASGGDKSSLAAIVSREQPGLTVWSTGTPSLSHDLGIAALIKRNAPATVTGVISTHVTVRPEEALAEPALDLVIRSEPEGIIRNLCLDGEKNWRDIRGISYRSEKGAVICHNEAEEYLSPDAIPPPAWHTVDLAPYRLPLKGKPFLIVAPIRGCPYLCNFCTASLYYGRKLRRRPIDSVTAEIEADIAQCGIGEFLIWADTFTADANYVRQFCRAIIDRNLAISWSCNSRVDTVDRETLGLMKDAGLWMIGFGIEAGNEAVLRATGKEITVAQSRLAVQTAHDLGIRVAGHFMFGLPGETEETMAETLSLALELPLDVAQFYAAAPFPGTGLFEEARREGWLRSDSLASQHQGSMELPGLPAARVDAFRRTAYRKFYGRPDPWRRLAVMTQWGAVPGFFRGLRRFFRWTS